MRQVFTSVRLENVESVERMLNDVGITTKITQGRSWKGVSRREFSYTAKNHDSSQQPALWVIKSEDFKRAREILHDAGLLDATRESSFLPDALQFRDKPAVGPRARVGRFRMILLGAVALGGALLMLRVFLA